MTKQRYFIMGFIGVIVLLLLTSNTFFDLRLNLTKGLASILGSSGDIESNQQIRVLERENADLRTKLKGLNYQAQGDYIVYSSYPFNNRSEIVIGDISNANVSPGDTVLYGNSILVGRVKQTTDNQAIVTTIFDPGFETAVRVGDNSTDALIKGGNTLELSLIPEEALIEVGDIVYTASKEFPYGLEIGTVTQIDTDKSTPLRTAAIEPFFTISSLRNVSILN